MISTPTSVDYSSPASIPMSFANVMTIMDINLTNIGSRTVSQVAVKAANDVFPIKASVAFASGHAQTNITLTNAMSVFLTDAPYGNVTARLVIFPMSLSETDLTFEICVKETDGNYLIYSVSKTDVTKDFVAGMPVNTTISVPTTDGISYSEITSEPPVFTGVNWWAPRNCGYDATNYKYGKLYQWGTTVGNGYAESAYPLPAYNDKNGTQVAPTCIYRCYDDYSDVTKRGKYYTSKNYETETTYEEGKICFDWVMKDGVWGGPSPYTTRTENDPCPQGWRVPSGAEFLSLGFSELNINVELDASDYYWRDNSDDNPGNLSGMWIGSNAKTKIPTVGSPKGCIFFPRPGNLQPILGGVQTSSRDLYGFYWSTTDYWSHQPYILRISLSQVLLFTQLPPSALPIRCVK